ncbi:MAG: sodium-translocating pyrophosphatase [Oscillospiraceae bacterium]|nr:sodium-translocating pyrophosphatase [Oscillospiraceae bacterium]
MVENLFWLGYVGAGLALGFAFIQARRILKYSEGNEVMVKIATAIRSGANAYLKRQYEVVAIFFSVMFIALLALSLFGFVNRYVPFAFVTGGFFTGLSGFIGMKVATYANARTANAATRSLNRALRIAFSSGTVMGFTVNGLGLLDITTWYLLLKYVFNESIEVIAMTMVTFGMGIATMAMFARVGGGIFTKAADVGADLVGKIEAGIPEDDPRNPAVIADNVGDNVGDVAGMGADLYESNSNAIVATIAIGIGAGYGSSGLLLPILISTVGVIASLIGTFFVRTKEQIDQKTLLRSLHKGIFVAGILAAIATLPVTLYIAKASESSMAHNAEGIFVAVILGIITGFIVSHFTEYYTSDASRPTRELAESSETGTATMMIGGLALGMKSTAGPIVAISVSAIISFFVSGGHSDFNAGLYGIGLAAVAMLATNAIILATDAFGPVVDNAGGIAEMAKLPKEVRERTDALDALGNTTAATGKGFAICSTAFTSLALLVAYVNVVKDGYIEAGKVDEAGNALLDLTLTNPPVLIGLFLGSALAFVFAALCISAVHRAAKSVVVEVRRQFREIEGLMEGTAEADYAACVDLCTRSAQKQMIAPSILAIASPVVVGVFLGAAGVVGLLAGVIVTGFAMAVFMMNSGGAWDNAKKHIESGNFGGKGSENHKSSVIGDTVGDPFKDTAGPSFNILITLSSTVALVFAGVTIAFSLV